MKSSLSTDTPSMRELQALVLASTSPRRFELLTSLGIDVRVVPSGVDEVDQPGLTPGELAAFHASAKAQAVAAREKFCLIVAADTIVDADGTALGKPRDENDARRMRVGDQACIEAYLATGESFDKAGAYGIQGRGAALVERIEGDFYAVMGFPLGAFVRRLSELRYALPRSASRTAQLGAA
jgi:septum formation protein